MEHDSKQTALRRGMLEPLAGRRRGATALRGRDSFGASFGRLPVQEGTLYPLLDRLGRDGLVEHEWQESAAGPLRRYLSLTKAGEDKFAQFRNYWTELTTMLETNGN